MSGAPLLAFKAGKLLAADSRLMAQWLTVVRRWPLLTAARFRRWDVCEHLLESGPAVDPPIAAAALKLAADAGQAQLVGKLMPVMLTAGNIPEGACQRPEDVWKLADDDRDFLALAVEEAVSRGDAPMYTTLLTQLPPSAAASVLGHTSINRAVSCVAQHGSTQLLCSFLDACQSLSIQPGVLAKLQHSALKAAVSYGREELVRSLLHKGVDVNLGRSCFHAEDSPLGRAMQHADYQEEAPSMVKLLLEAGACQNLASNDDAEVKPDIAHSALSYTIRNYRFGVVKLLMQHGGVVGERELLEALKNSAATFRLLLGSEAHMDPALRADGQRRSECLGRVLGEAIKRDDVDSVKLLLSPPAHWGPVTAETLAAGVQQVPELIQAHSGWYLISDVLRCFKEAGGSLDMGKGALLLAAVRHHNIHALKLIAEMGADVNVDGGAPLRLALTHPSGYSRYVVEELLRLGADATLYGGDFMVALAEKGRWESLRCLLGRGAQPGAHGPALLRAAVAKRQPRAVHSLLRVGVHLECGAGLLDLLRLSESDDLLSLISKQRCCPPSKVSLLWPHPCTGLKPVPGHLPCMPRASQLHAHPQVAAL
jgi:hypothetical protein